jgi:hypothetical protein
MLAQRFGRVADLALAGQKDQHVARPDAMQLVAGVGDRVVEIALVVRFLRQPRRLAPSGGR